MAADDVSRALHAWRAAIREAEAQAPGTNQRTVLDEKAERARLAYQQTINADTEPRPEGSEKSLSDVATAGGSGRQDHIH